MTALAMFRGDDRTLTITADEALTGSDITFTAVHRPGGEAVIAKATGSGITIDEEEATSALIALDAADTADLEPCVLRWDIQVVDALDKTHTVASGTLVIRADISPPASIPS